MRWGLLFLMVVVLAGCQKHAKVIKKSRKRLKKLQEVYKAKVLSNIPAKGERRLIRCREGSVKEPERQITLVQDDFLRKVVDPNAKTRKTKYLPQSFGTSKEMRRMAMDPKFYPLSFKKHIDNLERRRYLGVFLTDLWQTGKMRGKKIIRPARYKGWFALYDLKTGKIKTQFPIHVRSARYLTVWRKRGYKPNWGRAFRKSISGALGQWTNKYLKRYCPFVTVDSNPN